MPADNGRVLYPEDSFIDFLDHRLGPRAAMILIAVFPANVFIPYLYWRWCREVR